MCFEEAVLNLFRKRGFCEDSGVFGVWSVDADCWGFNEMGGLSAVSWWDIFQGTG